MPNGILIKQTVYPLKQPPNSFLTNTYINMQTFIIIDKLRYKERDKHWRGVVIKEVVNHFRDKLSVEIVSSL